jgi:tRNA U55 pseudouridine synthase TruB
VTSINEGESYLSELVSELGLQLKTNAVCRSIRCIRYGYFTLDHALLLKHVTLENVLRNMNDLKKIIRVNDNLRKQSPNIRTQINQV